METWQLPTINIEKCTHCGICEAYCPTGAIRLDHETRMPYFAQPAACAYCGICEDVCPAGAVELEYLILPLPPAEDA